MKSPDPPHSKTPCPRSQMHSREFRKNNSEVSIYEANPETLSAADPCGGSPGDYVRVTLDFDKLIEKLCSGEKIVVSEVMKPTDKGPASMGEMVQQRIDSLEAFAANPRANTHPIAHAPSPAANRRQRDASPVGRADPDGTAWSGCQHQGQKIHAKKEIRT